MGFVIKDPAFLLFPLSVAPAETPGVLSKQGLQEAFTLIQALFSRPIFSKMLS
jgi:hypothetical protein